MAKKKFGEWLLDTANTISGWMNPGAKTSAKNAQTVLNAAMPEYMNKNNAAPTSYGESLLNSATPAPAPTPAPEPASVASTVQAPSTSFSKNESRTANREMRPVLSSGATEEAEKTYEKYLQSQYDAAVSSAQKRFETDEIDAQRRYERSRADYGAQAEKLRELGVDTSGYESYLNDRAYAQMVSEIQAAKGRQADAITAAEQNHNNLYSEYLLNKSVQDAATKTADEEELQNELDSSVASGSLFGQEGAYASLDNANKKLQTALTAYGEGSPEYKEAKNQYDQTYGIRVDSDYFTPGADGNNAIGITADEFEDAEEGDKMTAWNGKERIKIRKGGIQGGDVAEAFASSDLSQRGTPIIFAFRGKAYIGYNGKVYAIQEGKKEYETLLKYLTDDSVSGVYR